MLTFVTDLGTCGIRWSADGVTQVAMPRERGLVGRPFDTDDPDVPPQIGAAVGDITALMARKHRDLSDIALDWEGIDPFRRSVLEATRAVGPGEVVTYGELACAVGVPGAARAVGNALGDNPRPIVVPCHRVLAADGALTGFSSPGGVATKPRMLEIEGAPGFVQQPLFA